MLSLDAGRQSGHRRRSSAARSSIRRLRDRRSPSDAAQRGSPGRRYRGLRALQSVRRGRQQRGGQLFQLQRDVTRRRSSQLVFLGLRLRRFEPAVRAAGRPGPLRSRRANIARRRPSINQRSVRRQTASPTASSSASSIRRSVRGEGSLRRTPDPDPEGHALLPRADASAAPRASRTTAARVGTVWTYNAGLDWAPVRDLRFRGNYSRAVRAPNVSETGFPLVPNFAPGFLIRARRPDRQQPEPCGQLLADLGRAAGRPADVTYSLPIVSGSNPDLEAETSDSLDGRCGHPAALGPGPVAQRRLLRDQGERHHRLAQRADDRQQLLRPAGPRTTCSARSSTRYLAVRARSARRSQPGQILGNSLISAGRSTSRARRARASTSTSPIARNFGTMSRLEHEPDLHAQSQDQQFREPDPSGLREPVLGELGDPEGRVPVGRRPDQGCCHLRLPDALHRPDVDRRV